MLARVTEAARRSSHQGRLAPLAAIRDYYTRPSLRSSWGGPLNGQAFRRVLLESLLTELQIEQIVETGTFRGTTTDLLKDFAEVWTIEASARFYWYARLRFRGEPRVHPLRGDSRAALRELSQSAARTDPPTLFYLDAHWGTDLPLAEELAIVDGGWRRWVALIDDFRVPEDDGYGFDSYSEEATLDEAYLRRCGPPGLRIWYPRLPARFETGEKRGCAVATTDQEVAAHLEALASLIWESSSAPSGRPIG